MFSLESELKNIRKQSRCLVVSPRLAQFPAISKEDILSKYLHNH